MFCSFLDSLIFNNEVDSYKSWTLFLIFLSISVLISGVVLLTHKKPEPVTGKTKSATPRPRQRRKVNKKTSGEGGELEGEQHGDGESSVLWAVGEASDGEDDLGEDEDVDHHQHPLGQPRQGSSSRRNLRAGREGLGLIDRDEGEGADDPEVIDRHRHKTEDIWNRRSMDPFRDDTEQGLEQLGVSGGSGVIR